jgi:hypothetical protein
MKIKKTKEISLFYERCKQNIIQDYKNDFLGLIVTEENEREIQEELAKACFAEFKKPKHEWPSLFISTDEFKNSPYHSHVKIDHINDEDITFYKETIPSNQLFNASSIIYDDKKELNDWMKLRALDKPYEANVLTINGDVWMLDVPGESNTMDSFANKATGNVLVFGLGIGYFVYMTMMNPNVKSITIVEKNDRIIQLFMEHVYPQFPKGVPLNIICDDAFNYFNQDVISDYDYVFVDIYQSSDDGFLIIEKLLEQYLPPFDHVDFWIESSCFEFVPALMLFYFEAVTYNHEIGHQDPLYHRIMMKIDRYFSEKDLYVDREEDLKELMYDHKIIREVLSKRID